MSLHSNSPPSRTAALMSAALLPHSRVVSATETARRSNGAAIAAARRTISVASSDSSTSSAPLITAGTPAASSACFTSSASLFVRDNTAMQRQASPPSSRRTISFAVSRTNKLTASSLATYLPVLPSDLCNHHQTIEPRPSVAREPGDSGVVAAVTMGKSISDSGYRNGSGTRVKSCCTADTYAAVLRKFCDRVKRRFACRDAARYAPMSAPRKR